MADRPKLADIATDFGETFELACVQVGAEVLRVTVQETKRRARCIGKPSGMTCFTSFWFEPADAPGTLAPSKFGKAAPTCDARLLPLLAKLLHDAALEANREGLLTAGNWAVAGLPVPEDE